MTSRRFSFAAWPIIVAVAIVYPAVAVAQTPATPEAQSAKPKPKAKPAAKPAAAKPAAAKPAAATPATPAAAKPAPAKPAAAKPAPAKPAAAKPAPAKPAVAKPAAPAKPATPVAAPAPAASSGDGQPVLLGKYAEWGAYSATPSGGKVCFALAKPASSQTNPAGRPRDPANFFVSSRPAEKVKDEVSIIIGYGFKPNSAATLNIGSASFAMQTQNDGAWIKNAADEAKMVDALRKGSDAVVKGVSAKGTQTTDTFSLKGLAQAIDRIDQECK
jgi:hypothetical protein